jgi:ABC-2 type transport system ATP-binding protein
MMAIEAVNLSRKFKELWAVDALSFSVHRAEIFGFLGPNGAGKTTTIKMLTGQLRPTMGYARVVGCDITTDRDDLHSRIGVVFEEQNVYERLSARENLQFAARLYGVERQRVDEVIQLVGLSTRTNEKVKNYSNGMKQRLLIARALLSDPEIIFLDEPTKGLDPGISRVIRNIIIELARKGITVFLTTHYMEEADQLCDRVAIIHGGKLIALDTPENLKGRIGQTGVSLEDVFIQLTGKELYN